MHHQRADLMEVIYSIVMDQSLKGEYVILTDTESDLEIIASLCQNITNLERDTKEENDM